MLSAVDQLADNVEVTGMGGRLGQHMEDHFAHGRQLERAEEVRPPSGGGVQPGSPDETVSVCGLETVGAEYLRRAPIGVNRPTVIVAEGIDSGRITSHDAAEPEGLDVDGEVLNEPETAPSGGEDRPPQIGLGQPLDGREDMLASPAQRVEEGFKFNGHE